MAWCLHDFFLVYPIYIECVVLLFNSFLSIALTGPLPKAECAEQFSKSGCKLCLNIFSSAQEAANHQAACQLPPASLPVS